MPIVNKLNNPDGNRFLPQFEERVSEQVLWKKRRRTHFLLSPLTYENGELVELNTPLMIRVAAIEKYCLAAEYPA